MEELKIELIFSYPFLVCKANAAVQLVYVMSIDNDLTYSINGTWLLL